MAKTNYFQLNSACVRSILTSSGALNACGEHGRKTQAAASSCSSKYGVCVYGVSQRIAGTRAHSYVWTQNYKAMLDNRAYNTLLKCVS